MTPEERALQAAWKICSAWDGTITKPVLRKVIAAALKETEGSGEPVGEIVAASTPAAELLYGRDVRFYEAMRTLPIGTTLYAALTLKDDPGNGGDADEIAALRARCEKAEAALERLASVEGMTGSFYRKDNAEGLELLARLKFAEAALSQHRKRSEADD